MATSQLLGMSEGVHAVDRHTEPRCCPARSCLERRAQLVETRNGYYWFFRRAHCASFLHIIRPLNGVVSQSTHSRRLAGATAPLDDPSRANALAQLWTIGSSRLRNGPSDRLSRPQTRRRVMTNGRATKIFSSDRNVPAHPIEPWLVSLDPRRATTGVQ